MQMQQQPPQPQQQQWPVGYHHQQQQQPYNVQCAKIGPNIMISIIMIVAGALSILFNIVDLGVSLSSTFVGTEYYTIKGYTLFYSTGFVGHGFWCGVMCVVTGSFRLTTARQPRQTKFMSFSWMVLCVVTAALSVLQFAVAVIGAWRTSYAHFETCEDKYYGSYGYNGRDNSHNLMCDKLKTIVAMEAMLAICGIISTVAAIVASSLGCRSLGCCTDAQ